MPSLSARPVSHSWTRLLAATARFSVRSQTCRFILMMHVGWQHRSLARYDQIQKSLQVIRNQCSRCSCLSSAGERVDLLLWLWCVISSQSATNLNGKTKKCVKGKCLIYMMQMSINGRQTMDQVLPSFLERRSFRSSRLCRPGGVAARFSHWLITFHFHSLPPLIRGTNVCIWLQQPRSRRRRRSWQGGILLQTSWVNNAGWSQEPISEARCVELMTWGSSRRSQTEWWVFLSLIMEPLQFCHFHCM